MVQAAISSSVAFYTWNRELVIAWLEVSIPSSSLSLFLPFPLPSSLPLPPPFPLVLFVFLFVLSCLVPLCLHQCVCLTVLIIVCVFVHCLGLGGCSLLVHIGSQEQYQVRRDDGGMSIKHVHVLTYSDTIGIYYFLIFSH